MLRIKKISSLKIVLLLVLLAAAALRFIGTNPGFHPYHSDESNIYSTAIEMVKNNNIKLQRYEYPSLPHLINFFSYKFFFIPFGFVKYYLSNLDKILDGFLRLPLKVEQLDKVFQLEVLGSQNSNVLFWGRSVTALFGVGVVYLSFLIGSKLFSKRTGIITAVLVCVNYRQVLNSHFVLPDIYNAFFLLLAFLVALNLWKHPVRKNYLLAGLSLGFTLATKYQFFSFIPFLLVHLWNLKKVRDILSKKIILIPVVAILVFFVTNPYQIIDIEKTFEQVSYASKLYGVGTNQLSFYSYWYLYHFGLGHITSVLVLGGFIVSFIKEKKQSLLLLSIVFPFFLIFTFLSAGGFYTRNFVSITPFILIFAGFLIDKLVSNKNRFTKILVIAILLLSVWENLSKSLVIIDEYSKQWNFRTVQKWLLENIPKDAKMAAHSSVPYPDFVYRTDFDLVNDFSFEEFRQKGVIYAVASLDWSTLDYYWWMRLPFYESIGIGKPVDVMKKMYAALAIDELTDYSLFWITNDALAPDQDFIVARVPYYEVIQKKQNGYFFDFFDNKPTINGASSPPSIIWQTAALNIENWGGFSLDYEFESSIQKQNYRDGFLFVSFFKSEMEAIENKNPIAVRLSKRFSDTGNKLVTDNYVGKVPNEAKFAIISFASYSPRDSIITLEKVDFFEAVIKEDLGDDKVNKFVIPTDNMFPNSHGNL